MRVFAIATLQVVLYTLQTPEGAVLSPLQHPRHFDHALAFPLPWRRRSPDPAQLNSALKQKARSRLTARREPNAWIHHQIKKEFSPWRPSPTSPKRTTRSPPALCRRDSPTLRTPRGLLFIARTQPLAYLLSMKSLGSSATPSFRTSKAAPSSSSATSRFPPTGP